jgi:hypothetical protein
MVKPYLRTEWGYYWPGDENHHVVTTASALIAREIVNDWNNGAYGKSNPAVVVQRSISDWGEDT